MDKVRMPDEMRVGIELGDYVAKMDELGSTSLLIAVSAGDMRVKYSFAIPYERVAGYCEQSPAPPRRRRDRPVLRYARPATTSRAAVRDLGFVGAHLYPHWFELPPDHAKYYPFYAKCCELDVPIMMQVGHCLDYQRDRILP